MRRRIALITLLLLALSVAAMAAYAGLDGPAPNAGDGVSDGSGFDNTPAPNGDADAFGPAPNAGDGVSDGSGLTPPNR
jgi:hypothetical protein